MALPKLAFTKTWESALDFPTEELDEVKIRADAQLLHNEAKTFINEDLIPALGAPDAATDIGADIASVGGKTVQAVLDAHESRLNSGYNSTQTDAVVATNTNDLVKSVTFNDQDGKFTFTKKDGSTVVIDTVLEKVPVSMMFETVGGVTRIKLTNQDGTTSYADVSSLVDNYTFNNTTTVSLTPSGVGNQRVITADVRDTSIGLEKFTPAVVTTFEGYMATAAGSATAAQGSAASALLAKNAAATSEANALTFKSAAASSAQGAVTSAATAATKASDASTYAANATTSKLAAEAAKDQAVSAKNEAVAAQNNAVSAATSASTAVSGFDEKVAIANTNIDAKTAAFDTKVNTANTTIDAKTSTFDTKVLNANTDFDGKVRDANAAIDTKVGTANTSIENKVATGITSIDTKTSAFEAKAISANTTIEGMVSTATIKADEAAASATQAANAASEVWYGAEVATTKAVEAAASASTATAAIAGIAADANKAKSYAVGNTGTRTGENTDNAQYWSTVAREIATGDVASRTEARGYVAAHADAALLHKQSMGCLNLAGHSNVEGAHCAVGVKENISIRSVNAATKTITFWSPSKTVVVGDALQISYYNPETEDVFFREANASELVTATSIKITTNLPLPEIGEAHPGNLFVLKSSEEVEYIYAAHAEGIGTNATADAAHAEGEGTLASAYYAHAEGYGTEASGESSHAQNSNTVAQGKSQTAIGEFNIEQGVPETRTDTDHALIVGNGTDDTTRSNAMSLTWEGTLDVAKDVKVGGSSLLARIAALEAAVIAHGITL